jgi:hypothetical protein
MDKWARMPSPIWSYKTFADSCLDKYDNDNETHMICYDFKGRKQMPVQLYRHIKRALAIGLKIRRVEKSVYLCSESGMHFMTRIVRDLNHGAIAQVYEVKKVSRVD